MLVFTTEALVGPADHLGEHARFVGRRLPRGPAREAFPRVGSTASGPRCRRPVPRRVRGGAVGQSGPASGNRGSGRVTRRRGEGCAGARAGVALPTPATTRRARRWATVCRRWWRRSGTISRSWRSRWSTLVRGSGCVSVGPSRLCLPYRATGRPRSACGIRLPLHAARARRPATWKNSHPAAPTQSPQKERTIHDGMGMRAMKLSTRDRPTGARTQRGKGGTPC